MQVKKGFRLRKIDDLLVVLPTASAARSFHGMITLNESGAFLWNLLQEDTTEDLLCAALSEEYEIDEERARVDVHHFLETVREKNLIDD